MGDTTRREFLKALGIGGMVTVSWAGPLRGLALAAVPTYTGVSYLTPAYKGLMYGILGFNDQLKKHPEVLKVEFFDSGTLVKEDEQISAMRSGMIQYMFHTTSYITRTLPILGILGLPGVCGDLYRHGERLAIESPLWKLMNDQLAKDNIFMLTTGGGIMEPEYIWSGKKKVGGLADLQGMRCRVVGYEATEILKSFGVAGARIPSSETYLALQRGTVDALVANISTIVGRKLYEQIKYCYQLPVTGYSSAAFVLKDKWDKMPEKEKAVFWEAARWTDKNYVKECNHRIHKEEDWPILRKSGMEVLTPSEADVKAFDEKSIPIWKWWKDQVGEEVGDRAIKLALGKA